MGGDLSERGAHVGVERHAARRVVAGGVDCRIQCRPGTRHAARGRHVVT
jgi:hypothetical protein